MADVNEPTAPPADSVGDDERSVLDEHRSFVLSIDDASRMGHSVLGISAIVAVVVALVVSDTALFSWRALALVPLVGLVALVVGRRVGLTRQDRRLRDRVVRYCRDLGISEVDLAEEARQSGRYEFFVKLFSRTPVSRQPGLSNEPELDDQ